MTAMDCTVSRNSAASAIIVAAFVCACICTPAFASGADVYKIYYDKPSGVDIKVTFPGDDNTLVDGMVITVYSSTYNPCRLGVYIYDHNPALGKDYGLLRGLLEKPVPVSAGCAKFVLNMNSVLASDLWLTFDTTGALLTEDEKSTLSGDVPVSPDDGSSTDTAPAAAQSLDVSVASAAIALVLALVLLGVSFRAMAPMRRAV